MLLIRRGNGKEQMLQPAMPLTLASFLLGLGALLGLGELPRALRLVFEERTAWQ